MEDLFFNASNYPQELSQQRCDFGLASKVVLSLIDIIPFLVGQPLITKLLWTTLTSKKTTDILSCNLALVHSLHYLISILHLVVLFSLPHAQALILKFLFVYVEIGGPMSLSCICVERYVAVIHPMSYPLLKKYRFREVCAVAVWLFSVPIALASVLAMEALSTYKARVIDTLQILVLVVMTALTVRCSALVARTLKKSGPGTDKLHPVCLVFFFAASVVHPLFYLSTHGKLFTCLN